MRDHGLRIRVEAEGCLWPRARLGGALAGAIGASLVVLTLATPAVGQEDPRIEAMQRQIDELQRQLEALKGEVREVKQLPPPPAPVATTTVEGKPVVTSGTPKIQLAISGQINRAINIAGDGDKTKAYFVDNDTSNSRIRFVGTGQVSDDTQIGTKIELALAPNESSQVSQDNEDSGNFFDERYVEGWVESKRFGKLSLGKGDSASNNSAEADLSGTSVIMYASVADPVAGLEFRTKGGDLTGVKVSNAFSDFDGLSRKDRLRYDTPKFYGISLAGAVISNQRADAAAFWAAELGGFKAAAAAAIAQPNTDGVDYRLDGSASVLHEATGLNLTVSSGFDQADGGNPSNLYVKGGWIANFFDFGSSNFGIDLTRSVNNPTPSDQGWSVGGAFVQNLEDFGTQLYAQLRRYDLDRGNDPDVDPITAFTVGSRVKF